MIRGNLVRIEGVDADAIGKIPEVHTSLQLRNLEVTILEADETRIGLAEVRLLDAKEDGVEA